MRLYIAGKMTGVPQFNLPAFFEAAETLRAANHEPVLPADIDLPEWRKHLLASDFGSPADYPGGATWGEFLSQDVKLVADDVDGIAVLPCWRSSRGAKLELFTAFMSGKPVYRYPAMRRMSFTSFLLRLLLGVIKNA